MSRRAAVRVAWSLWALALLLLISDGALRFLNSSTPTTEPRNSLVLDGGFLLLSMAFATAGALIASRHGRNPIGWVFCALGIFLPLSSAGEEYALYTFRTNPGALPGGEAVAWAAGWFGGPILFALAAFVFLFFPDGRLLSRRWRSALWANLAAIVLLLAWSFKPGPIENLALVRVRNPFGLTGAGLLLDPLGLIGISLMFAAAAAGAVSLVLRLRRAVGDERQQLKWFVFAGAVFCAVFALGPLLWSLPPSPGTSWIWPALFLAGVGAIPTATGIAILKYRLYDIDRIINRALVYSALTVVLGVCYFGGIVLLQRLLHGLTGGDSQVAVVASTLFIAALFQPLRRRIQSLIDRRFYRRKYDAVKTLDAFSARLRDEVDLETLIDDIAVVVRETLQPEHVSLWISPTNHARAEDEESEAYRV